MGLRRARSGMIVLLASFLGMVAVASPIAQAATVTVINNDGAGEGFNDPAPRAPVGGNAGTTLGAQRLIAFQRAADIWGAVLNTAVTIRVNATFDALACNASSAVLGSAGPSSSFRDFSGALLPATWYPIALANALHGSDLDPTAADIDAQFNSAVGTTCAFPRSWYYGLDGNAGGDIDFVTVLLHELGHGLGFLTFVDLATGAKMFSRNDTFMINLENHGASPADFPSMTNAQRVAASTNTGNLHWVGAQVRAASGALTAGRVGDHVRMFAPNPQQPGSSVSHWDTALTPNQLMEPSYTVPLSGPGLELSLFQDIGWPLALLTLQVTPAANVSVAGSHGAPFSPSAVAYQLSATSGSVNFSISGLPSWLTASATSGTVTTTGTTITFTVNAGANALAPGLYGTTITFTNTTNGQGNTTRTATLNVRAVLGDFDGDGKKDLAVYRSATGEWFVFGSATGFQTLLFGSPASSGFGDAPVPADFDGDRKTDLAVYRQATGEWFVFGSATGFQTLLFGAPSASGLGDTAVPADFDGDGKADLAVYRKATGEWFVFGTATGFRTLLFGAPASSGLGDIPVPADYDGDGKADLAVYRQATGEWFIFGTATGFRTLLFGAPAASGLGDIPVPADFDRDGKADLAIYRRATGEWLVFGSATGFQTRLFGSPASSGLNDTPVQGDYDGDGPADLAVRRNTTGEWFVLQSSTGQTQTSVWGAPSDLPVPQPAH